MAKIRKNISLDDPKYFCNVSWTVSYNMNTKSWISFHSYIPNFYIAENNFFYSGINDCCEEFDFLVGTLVPTPSTTTTTTTPRPTTTTTTTTAVPLDCDFDALITELDCELEGTGVIVSEDCDLAGNGIVLFADCELVGNGVIIPATTTTTSSTTSTTTSTSTSTTTTTTSSTSSTTTTTTTVAPNCQLEGEGRVLDCACEGTGGIIEPTTTTTTSSTTLSCLCFTYDVVVGQTDLDDATGNTDISQNNKLYVSYDNCAEVPSIKEYSIANTYLDDICVNTGGLGPIIYYYKDNNQTVPAFSSISITVNNCCP